MAKRMIFLVSLWLRLPLFPTCTHADCSSNYKMEESPAKPEERPYGEAGRPQDASPWGRWAVAAWSIPGRHRCGWERQKGGEAEPRPVCPAALAATHDHKKAPKEKQKHMTHNVTLAKKVTSEKLPCVAKLPCRSSAVVLSGKPLAQHKLRNQAGKAVSLWLRLPLFPACTHADCSSNYKMEESPAKPEERPNGEAGRPQDASPSPKTRTRPKTIVAVRSSKPDKNSQAWAI